MNEENTLSFIDCINIVKKRKKLIIIVTVLSMVVVALISYFVMKPVYEANTSIIVGKPQSTVNSQTNLNDITMYQDLVATYVQITQSKLVAQEAVQNLNSGITIAQLQSSITVTPGVGTQIMTIKAKSDNPQDAMNITNAVSGALIDQSKIVFPTGGEIQVMDKADMPIDPISPNKKLNIAIAFFLGIMVSVGGAFLLESLDDTIKTESDVEKYLELPIIGMIPKFYKLKSKNIDTSSN